MATILVIDDDDALYAMVKDVLEQEGYQVRIVHTALAALRQLDETPPDLILCGYVLPHLNGLEVCATLRESPAYRTIPYILMSTMPIQAPSGVSLPPVLRKPFNSDELLTIVASQLGQR